MHRARTLEGEHRLRPIARLLGELRIVDGAAVDSRRGAGLQPSDGEFHLAQARSERKRGRVAGPAALVVVQTDMDAPAEEGARGEDHRARGEAQADGGHRTRDARTLYDQVVDGLLEDPQVGMCFETAPDGRAVENAVGLGPRGADGGSLARVERPELDPRLVGCERHGTAQRVDLLHEVALADAPDGGVA